MQSWKGAGVLKWYLVRVRQPGRSGLESEPSSKISKEGLGEVRKGFREVGAWMLDSRGHTW